MGNLLVCFKSAKDTDPEDEYDAFQRDVYRSGRSSQTGTDEDTGSEEKIERRGSVFPPSPSTYRSSLGPSSIIPPYIEGSSPSLRRGTKSPSAGATDMAPVKKSKEVRILLLGSGESGKSTITKQMKVIHQNGYSRDEQIAFRPAVFRNIKQGIEQVIQAAQKLNLSSVLTQAETAIKTTRTSTFDPETATTIPKHFVDAVNYIWLESGVKTIFDQLAHASYVFDSAS